MDSSNWQQGGVTTVVTPSAAPPPSFELLQPSSSSQEDQEKKVNRGGGRKPRDHMEEESLCPEEEERRKMRRERNKLAAARCRKRRVDQTETLQDEVNLWENKKKALQEQIQQLQEEKTQLAFIGICPPRCETVHQRASSAGESRTRAASEHSEASHPCRGNGGQQSTGDGDNDSPTSPKTEASVQPSRWQQFKQ